MGDTNQVQEGAPQKLLGETDPVRRNDRMIRDGVVGIVRPFPLQISIYFNKLIIETSVLFFLTPSKRPIKYNCSLKLLVSEKETTYIDGCLDEVLLRAQPTRIQQRLDTHPWIVRAS